jgi:hypothetical protein
MALHACCRRCSRRRRRRRRLLGGIGARPRDAWRGIRDPYRICLGSDAAANPGCDRYSYYARFVARFLTLPALAAAPPAAVLAAWSGLGYYRRGTCTKPRGSMREHGGRVPDDPPAFLRLPGVGRYTAGAVSIAFDRPLPVLDGNVARVFSRLCAARARATAAGARTRGRWRRHSFRCATPATGTADGAGRDHRLPRGRAATSPGREYLPRARARPDARVPAVAARRATERAARGRADRARRSRS